MESAELLSVLCRELPELRAVAEETGDGDRLEEALAAARRGEPVAERLRALGLLRLLESWGTTRGVPQEGEPSGLVALPGGDRGGRVALGGYRCPAGACRRAEQPRPGDDLPVCALHGRPLRFR
ncbi:hypothetical protein ACWC0A_06070 [Streptomyces scopuliridis]|uniref:hypothetical protein n=1 Tax=Streptomyces scopuliridis TaxID=452529 RepID=UPI00369C0381